jgi:hypothetical protein
MAIDRQREDQRLRNSSEASGNIGSEKRRKP